jgi:hypothetical protein
MTPNLPWDEHAQAWIERFTARFGKRFVVLFNTARWQRDAGYHEAAIITAHITCELCTQIVLTSTLDSRGIGYLADPVKALLPSYNLAHPKVRKFYEAATGDAIGQAPFWSDFMIHNDKRNGAVHRGESATRADADASIVAVQEVIEHIQEHYNETWRVEAHQ